jgi:hypothetical protein
MGTLMSKPRDKYTGGLASQLFNSHAQYQAKKVALDFRRGLTPTTPTGMPAAGPSRLDHSMYSATNATKYVASKFF